MEFYNEILAFSNRWGCTVNEAFALAIASFIIFLALFSWSISFFIDFGGNLYTVIKKLFTYIRKGILFLSFKFRCRL